ncbi:MAG: nucleotide exchange factor GrpE [Lachnospiraceae bacterium]|nr:nucleotide exchange factor GrpE [Lachnospiraceae bacterium]
MKEQEKNRKAKAAESVDPEETEKTEAETAEEDLEVTAEAESDEVLDAETEVIDDGKKKGLFKKKKDNRDERIEELEEELKDLKLRNMAEFENFRKRTEKEKSQMFDMGAKNIIEKILPVIDTFERALAPLDEEQKKDPFVQGMENTYRLMMDSLTAAGLEPIEALGKEFDPDFHCAVMQEENEEFGENTVSQELQKGYMYHDTVVRFSTVKVANPNG